MRALVIVALSLLALGPAAAFQETPPAVSDGYRNLWTGERRLSADSLFAQFRTYRENERFVTEPILDGEELPAFLERLGVTGEDAAAVAEVFLAEAEVDSLPAGASVRVKFARSPATVHQLAAGNYPRGLEALEVLVGSDRLVAVQRVEGGFEAVSRDVDIERRYVAAAGEINSSLFGAANGAGVPRNLMIEFADVFAFDVDFAREIFRGDRFEIVYELLYDRDGNEIGTGEVLFAALTWKGGKHAKGYYRFHPEGAEKASYYAADGRNPRTLLMKTPINGARVTSRFGRRRHPVLGFVKGHAGIDFGAPTGTPVMAAGDGTVELAGPRGTFGNYIQIEHSGGFETAYAHLNGFAKGITRGTTVRQGEVIGYVGTTGRSTGPHLHYEVRKGGVPQNPERIKVAVGETLEAETLEAFAARRDAIDALRLQPFAVAEARLP